MELVTGLGASLGSWSSMLLGYIIPFLFVLTLVVFFHELGHFWVARRAGVRVLTFSLGFGPELVGFNDRHGTRWRIAAIPLGGYVRFFGDEDAASTPDSAALSSMSAADRKVSFFYQPLRWRAAIVAAGPIANFIAAIVIYTLLFATLGKPVIAPIVDAVTPGSAAAEAGFEPGDVVLSIDGRPIDSFFTMQRIVTRSAGLDLAVEIERAGQPVLLHATPRIGEITDPFGNKQRVGLLGIQRKNGTVKIVHFGPVEAFGQAFAEFRDVIGGTLGYLEGIAAGRQSADQIGGPIGIAKASGEAAALGFIPLVNLAAILSISIGLLNLFPIPLLDGGHLVYYAIEAVRGRPLSERAQDYGFRIGFAVVLMLMVLGTFNDIVRLVSG